MPSHHQHIGSLAEDIVAQWLQDSGLKIVMRNHHTRYGELDIVARDAAGVLHIIEVKARRNDSFGLAASALTRTKFRRLVQSVQVAQQVGHLPYSRLQYDFAAVYITPSSVTIDWFWNIGWDDFS